MNIKKRLIAGSIAMSLLVVGALPVAAYTGGYSFDITFAVYGTTTHTLSNVATSIGGQGESYNSNGTVSSVKDTFETELHKTWLTKYNSGYITADWGYYTKNIGVISSGDYTVNVYKRGGNTHRVVGHGHIMQ
jgi:hypothetical protein